MTIKIHGMALAIVTEDPSNPIEGQIWYNSTDDQIKFFDHTGIVQSINDVYEGLVPPSVTYEILWLKTDDNILFKYNSTQEKWISVQRFVINFNVTSRLYSGTLNERIYLRNPATLINIYSPFDTKIFKIQADGVDLHQFTSPYNATNLFVDVPAGTMLTCYTPTQIVDLLQLFVENSSVTIDAAWIYP